MFELVPPGDVFVFLMSVFVLVWYEGGQMQLIRWYNCVGYRLAISPGVALSKERFSSLVLKGSK